MPTKKKTTKRKTAAPKKSAAKSSNTASGGGKQIETKIKSLGDWRGETLARVRALIKQALPDVEETMKWGDVPVWERDGIICTGETYKEWVKLTFAKGASLKDPSKLFNSSLEGNARRAIDIRAGDKINETAFKDLIRSAAELNGANRAKKKAQA